jgi:hypothetical protein
MGGLDAAGKESATWAFDSLLRNANSGPYAPNTVAGARGNGQDPYGISNFLGQLQYTDQTFLGREKAFRAGASFLQEQVDNYQSTGWDYGDMQNEERKAKADIGRNFANTMNMGAQLFEGAPGGVADSVKGMHQAIALRQSLGGTIDSMAGAAQAAAGDAAFGGALKTQLSDPMQEAGINASEDKTYTFNFKILGKSWEGYFDQRLAAEEKGQKFDEKAWAEANPQQALATVLGDHNVLNSTMGRSGDSYKNQDIFTRFGAQGASMIRQYTQQLRDLNIRGDVLDPKTWDAASKQGLDLTPIARTLVDEQYKMRAASPGQYVGSTFANLKEAQSWGFEDVAIRGASDQSVAFQKEVDAAKTALKTQTGPAKLGGMLGRSLGFSY